MPIDGRLRNELSRDASKIDIDVDRFLGEVMVRGRRRRRLRHSGGIVAVAALIVVVAWLVPALLDAIRHQREMPVSPGPSKTTSVAVDPLVGVWQSTTMPRQIEALAKSRFPGARSPSWQHAVQSFASQNGNVGVNTMQFQDGHLSVETSADGGPPQGEWNGVYELVNDDTFVAGDKGNYYITFRFRIDGNRLTVHVVKDLFPGDVGRNPPPVPDLLPQVLLWETAPFIKVG